MKSKVIFSLSILIPFSLVFIYVWSTATDMVFNDDFWLINELIKKYYTNVITFSDLWRSADYSINLGYNLLLLANIKLFSLNSKIFALMLPFFILASALLIYRNYRVSLASECSPEFIAATFFIITFIIFNMIQHEALSYGNAISYQLSMPFFIANFIGLELFLSKGTWKYFFAALITSILAFLVFGQRLIVACAPAMVLTFLLCLITRGFSLSKDFRIRTLITVLFLAAIAFLYLFSLHYNDYTIKNSFFAAEIFLKPWDAVLFLLNAFGSSVLGIDAFFASDYLSFHHIQILGFVIVLLYIFALVLFFRSHMYEKTYLPVFLIMATFFYLSLMIFKRLGFGLDWGMASRYTYVSIYGLASMVWIFIFTLTRRTKPDVIVKSVIYGSMIMIIAGLFLTSIVVWRIQPSQKAHLKLVREIALRIDTATPEDIARIDSFQESVRDTLLLLKEHRLNIYRTLPPDRE